MVIIKIYRTFKIETTGPQAEHVFSRLKTSVSFIYWVSRIYPNQECLCIFLHPVPPNSGSVALEAYSTTFPVMGPHSKETNVPLPVTPTFCQGPCSGQTCPSLLFLLRCQLDHAIIMDCCSRPAPLQSDVQRPACPLQKRVQGFLTLRFFAVSRGQPTNQHFSTVQYLTNRPLGRRTYLFVIGMGILFGEILNINKMIEQVIH